MLVEIKSYIGGNSIATNRDYEIVRTDANKKYIYTVMPITSRVLESHLNTINTLKFRYKDGIEFKIFKTDFFNINNITGLEYFKTETYNSGDNKAVYLK